MFIVRLMVNDVDCGLLVDTQGFSYMRYVSIIKEFGDMYDLQKGFGVKKILTPNSENILYLRKDLFN